MDIEAIRQDTAEIMAGVDGWDPDYITDELIATLDEFEEVEGSATFDDDLIVAALVYYGNRPVFIRDTSRPGFVGRLLIYNGSANRPNDQCGSRFRRAIWFYHSPRGTPYRNCGSYWGFQFINA